MTQGIMCGEIIFFDQLPDARTKVASVTGVGLTRTVSVTGIDYDDFTFLTMSCIFQKYFDKTATTFMDRDDFILKTKKNKIIFHHGHIVGSILPRDENNLIGYRLMFNYMDITKSTNLLTFL